MKVNKQLIKIIQKIEGNVLGFGLNNDDLLDAISDNQHITECNLLNLKGHGDNSSSDGKKLKSFSIRSLRKKFKKKKTNVIIANDEDVQFFYTNFIKDSIYLANREIYLFFYSNDYEKVIKRYKRYHTKIKVISCSDGIILKIDVTNIKSTRWKDFKWNMIDQVSNVVDIITDIMTT